MGGRAVVDVSFSEAEDGTKVAAGVKAKNLDTMEVVEYDADAVVFAVGINAMQKIVKQSQGLAQLEEFRKILNLSTIDCVCARIWLKDRVRPQKPANVLGNFEEDCGATFFHLNDLHNEFRAEGIGSVFQCDFYHANAIVPLSDEEIVNKCLKNMKVALAEEAPETQGAMVMEKVEHFEVIRAVNAVTHFRVGSHKHRPEQKTSVSNLLIAGDWVSPLHLSPFSSAADSNSFFFFL